MEWQGITKERLRISLLPDIFLAISNYEPGIKLGSIPINAMTEGLARMDQGSLHIRYHLMNMSGKALDRLPPEGGADGAISLEFRACESNIPRDVDVTIRTILKQKFSPDIERVSDVWGCYISSKQIIDMVSFLRTKLNLKEYAVIGIKPDKNHGVTVVAEASCGLCTVQLNGEIEFLNKEELFDDYSWISIEKLVILDNMRSKLNFPHWPGSALLSRNLSHIGLMIFICSEDNKPSIQMDFQLILRRPNFEFNRNELIPPIMEYSPIIDSINMDTILAEHLKLLINRPVVNKEHSDILSRTAKEEKSSITLCSGDPGYPDNSPTNSHSFAAQSACIDWVQLTEPKSPAPSIVKEAPELLINMDKKSPTPPLDSKSKLQVIKRSRDNPYGPSTKRSSSKYGSSFSPSTEEYMAGVFEVPRNDLEDCASQSTSNSTVQSLLLHPADRDHVDQTVSRSDISRI